MKKHTALLAALLLSGSVLTASPSLASPAVSTTLTFDWDAGSGYTWTGFVLSGSSVELSDSNGTYHLQNDPAQPDYIGGTTAFSLTPLTPGRSLIVFTSQRSWSGEIAEEVVILADVDESLQLTTTDISESSVIEGMVTDVNEEEHSVLLDSETAGEISARFESDTAMPVPDETICLYTDGTMTMSLPAVVNVLAWKTLPSDEARADEIDVSDSQLAETIVWDMAEEMTRLVSMEGLSSMYSSSEDVAAAVEKCRESLSGTPVSIYEWDGVQKFRPILTEVSSGDDVSEELIDYFVRNSLYNASTLASMASAKYGSTYLAASSLLHVSRAYPKDIPSAVYIAAYASGSGVVVGMRNDRGAMLVSASYLADISDLNTLLTF